jgi:sugar phosphate permease
MGAVAALFASRSTSLLLLALVFAWAGIYTGVAKPLEAALTADTAPSESRGTAYGLLGSVNGVGDLVSSALVGMLWTRISPQASFCAAGALMLAGTTLLASGRSTC